jgi:hypothetical protein
MATSGTTRPGIGVRASRVRITPWMIQGWRPTSVTIHPASIASTPSGEASTSAQRNHRGQPASGSRRRRSQRIPEMRARAAMAEPQATITWNARWTTTTLGRSSTGNASRPTTVAPGSP